MTVHAHDLYVERPMLAEKAAGAAFIVTISDFNRRLLRGVLGPRTAERVSVVRCGVDTSRFAPAADRPPRRVPLVACVGSLEEYKGHRYLLEACARLKHDGVRCRVVCVGGGRLRGELQRQLRSLRLHGMVRFVGPADHEQVRRLLASASAFVLPSIVTQTGKMEGIPVALMEAMSMEVPVVATRISGIPELVEEGRTGLLVPPRDPLALARALIAILRSRDLSEHLGRAARTHILCDYDLRVNTARLLDLMKPFLTVRRTTLRGAFEARRSRARAMHPAAVEVPRHRMVCP
jgi:glycosyltransferase involved in cell wall biosynthesis